MISPDLLELLRCPATGQRLIVANDETLRRLNSGRQSAESFGAALVRVDGTAAYPVRDGIPVLLVDESIALP